MTSDLAQTGTAPTAIGTDEAELRDRAEAVLRRLVGRDDVSLRQDQWTAIRALIVDHARALVVQRTGWGKSAVYFVATALLREAGSGPTLIVSPLLALMRDQVAAAKRAGIRAITLNSTNTSDWDSLHQEISSGQADLILCSPERLNNPVFREEVLGHLAASAGLVVIDEAHCISDWGHDFRPDYRRIKDLLTGLPAQTPVLATTATANERVVTDVADQLGAGVITLRGGLDRASLHLAVGPVADQSTRLAWLAQHLGDYPGSGIIYCLTVAAAEETARFLREAGHDCAAYTGQTDTGRREELEGALLGNEVKALVATSALGMGFDKSDLAFVIHLGAPASPIGYYQQIGRAGRATDTAQVVLLPGPEDASIWAYFGSLSFPAEAAVSEALAILPSLGDKPMSTAGLESHVDLRRTRLELMLKVLDVDGAVQRVRGGWVSTGQPWVYDADRYARVAEARTTEQNAMAVYLQTSGCRMSYLRACLDDPTLLPDATGKAPGCGRCDNCGGTAPIVMPEAGAADAVASALRRPGVEITPRKQWPTGLGRTQAGAGLTVGGARITGRITAPAQTGRALARLDGLGLSLPVRDAVSGADGPVPAALRDPLAHMLRDWDLEVDGIIAVDSVTRPQLLRHLATGVSALVGAPIIGAITPRADAHDPTPRDVNSAHRFLAVARRLEMPELDVAGKRILLVDDLTDSGWTLTVAAQLLVGAGATHVYPLTLGLG